MVVLYSGYLVDDSHTQDTWIYSFEEENWILKNPDNPPLGQYGHYMVYVDSTGQLLMYPGHWCIYSNGVMVSHGFGGNIWEYDVVEDTWTEHFSGSIPHGRFWGNLVYDSTDNRLILFGGHGATDYDDTWVYNLEEKIWDKAIQNIKPSKRGSIGMAYDPVNHAVVLFGGYGERGQSLGDTWILDCETLAWYQPENTSTTGPEDSNSSFSISGFPLLAITLAIILILFFQKISTIE